MKIPKIKTYCYLWILADKYDHVIGYFPTRQNARNAKFDFGDKIYKYVIYTTNKSITT